MPDGKVGGWDPVRFSAMNEREAASKVISSVSAGVEAILSTSTEREPFLAGADDILAQRTDYCLRSFALHASMGIVRCVSALLLTGRAGAEKISTTEVVRQRLEVDPRVYTHTLYIDLVKHAEKPVPMLKGLFKH